MNKSTPIKVKNKVIGHMWLCKNGKWECEHKKTGMSWGLISSEEEAVKLINDHDYYSSQEYVKSLK